MASSREYRSNMTPEKKAHYNEMARLRMVKWRLKQKEQEVTNASETNSPDEAANGVVASPVSEHSVPTVTLPNQTLANKNRLKLHKTIAKVTKKFDISKQSTHEVAETVDSDDHKDNHKETVGTTKKLPKPRKGLGSPLFVYKIDDAADEPIEDNFYSAELQAFLRSRKQVERLLQTRGRGTTKEAFAQ